MPNSKLNNYFRLLRLHQPIGIFLVLWPALWGILLSYKEGSFPLQTSLYIVLGSIFARSAGCVINDIIDKDTDSKVHRTKNRPLASGEVSIHEALIILLFLAIISLCVASKLPVTSLYICIFSILPISIYPLMKYITYWPQAFLGIIFNLSNIIGSVSVTEKFELRNLVLYLGCIFWTIGYDTIYGCQDKDDDLKIGVKSSAILLRNNIKSYLILFYAIFFANLLLAGYLYELKYIFYFLNFITLLHLIWQILFLDISSPQDCSKKFISNLYLGGLISLIIFISK